MTLPVQKALKPLVFALDYDDTYTAAPEVFKGFVSLLKMVGHEVCFVTYRHALYGNNDDICCDAESLGIEIVFTNGRQKEHVFKADIWIDDRPETIVSAKKMGDGFDNCLMIDDMGDN